MGETYTVTQWGRVYRSNGATSGITGVISGLAYQDVCEQIRHCSERNRRGLEGYLTITDKQGKSVSVGHFVLD